MNGWMIVVATVVMIFAELAGGEIGEWLFMISGMISGACIGYSYRAEIAAKEREKHLRRFDYLHSIRGRK